MVTLSAPVPRRVVVVGLGGTIAMTPHPAGGIVPALSADQLVAAVPGLAETGIAVDVKDFRQVPGASISFADLDSLSALTQELFDHGADGVVITQGTDTLEETSYLFDLAHHRPEPVVFTGAMRGAAAAGADGPGNVLAAIQVAASPEVRDLGVLVVLADTIHAARRVRKTHPTSPHTFQSANGGPLGQVIEGQVRLLNRPVNRITAPALASQRDDVEVALVTMVLGDTGTLIEAAADRLDGLVVAALGAGHVPSRLIDLLTRVAARIPVVLASRTGAGAVLSHTYGYPGSESDLLNRGLISAGFLDGLKARILLRQLLVNGHDDASIRASFAEAGK